MLTENKIEIGTVVEVAYSKSKHYGKQGVVTKINKKRLTVNFINSDGTYVCRSMVKILRANRKENNTNSSNEEGLSLDFPKSKSFVNDECNPENLNSGLQMMSKTLAYLLVHWFPTTESRIQALSNFVGLVLENISKLTSSK